MSKFHKALIGAVATASFVALAGTGFAQQAKTAQPDAPPPPPHAGERSDPAQRADRLRQILRLTAGQEPAFQAWLAATAQKARGERQDRAAPRPTTTPERLDQQLARSAERQTAFKARADATKRFYGALTTEQKTVFDALGAGRRGGHGGKAMHGGRGGGHRHDHRSGGQGPR